MEQLYRVVVPLRVLLGLAFAASVVAQLAIAPGTLAHMAQESPDDAHLRWPILVVSVLTLACVEAVIVCTWRLLTMVRDDRIFSERAFVWVDAILAAIAAAWVLLLGAFVYATPQLDDPGLPVLLMFMLLALAVLGLLMVVMRALLRQATTLRADMEAVI
jgi:hypothetical protein